MTAAMAPSIPRYGEASLAEVVPSVLAALGVPGFDNRLEVEPLPGVCLMVVDGLGWELLQEHPGDAPFLAEAATSSGRAITTVFPATTSASLASLGTGLPPGQHGLVGYTFAVPGHDRAMNSLQWELYGIGPYLDLRKEFPPEEFQPMPTVLERAASAGFEVTLVGPSAHAASGLTRAILRGGRYVGADALEQMVDAVATTLTRDGKRNAYAYHPFLDTFGHLRGVSSDEWREHLLSVDRAAQAIYERLPSGFARGLAMTSCPCGGRRWATGCGWSPKRKRSWPGGSDRRYRNGSSPGSGTSLRPPSRAWACSSEKWTRCRPHWSAITGP